VGNVLVCVCVYIYIVMLGLVAKYKYFCTSRRISHFRIQNTDSTVKNALHIEICLKIKFYILKNIFFFGEDENILSL
jgi:hypothetical protein